MGQHAGRTVKRLPNGMTGIPLGPPPFLGAMRVFDYAPLQAFTTSTSLTYPIAHSTGLQSCWKRNPRESGAPRLKTWEMA